MRKIINAVCIILVASGLQGCVTSSYYTPQMTRTLNRFSVAKRSGVKRHFIRNKRMRLSPDNTKPARYSSGR